MVIVTQGDNRIEVRIKRVSDGTYFDEHVKAGDREKPDAENYERYIIPEPGVTYEIEVTLKQGFQFNGCQSVKVKLILPGASLPYELSEYIRFHAFNHPYGIVYADEAQTLKSAGVVVAAGRKISGARLAFRDVLIDEGLQNETDVMGVNPRDLGAFKIELMREWYIVRYCSKQELRAAEAKEQKEINKLGSSRTAWDASNVDQETFKKHGITSALGFVGGHAARARRLDGLLENYSRDAGQWISFFQRPKDFLERVNIVLYPPPLHSFSWELLDDAERKIAFLKLQSTARRDFVDFFPDKTVSFNRHPALRPWNVLDVFERRATFRTLQAAQKSYQRREVRTQLLETPKERIISLINDDVTASAAVAASRRASANPTIIIDDPTAKSARRKPQYHPQPTIKHELKKETRSPSVASTATLGIRNSPHPMFPINQKPQVKREFIDIDSLYDRPTNERRKISQETINVDALEDVQKEKCSQIKQEIIELDSLENAQRETSVKIKREFIDLDSYDGMGHSSAIDSGYRDSHSQEPTRKRVKFEEDRDMDVVEIVESGQPEEPAMTEEERLVEAERISVMQRLAELRRMAEGDMDH